MNGNNGSLTTRSNHLTEGCFLISTPDICFDAKDGYSYCWCRFVTIIIILTVITSVIIVIVDIMVFIVNFILNIDMIVIMFAAQRTCATAVQPP